VVIDVGRPFWINSEGRLYVEAGGEELRPEKLLQYAQCGYWGMKLLYDADDEEGAES
jgi:hypothetical protein